MILCYCSHSLTLQPGPRLHISAVLYRCTLVSSLFQKTSQHVWLWSQPLPSKQNGEDLA